ncbi:neural cell adhesion molecule L1 isoform X2 [Protopterus annectens]|uniref:neural cell adhesion molecule L1 isoform X2 n=1 Tax=Protopterus annectens TaxID=7888 RepID=UPI001CFBF0C2|nr:neural cell adhesion molecule L1 isoform X2 [Protopterus annectens]
MSGIQGYCLLVPWLILCSFSLVATIQIPAEYKIQNYNEPPVITDQSPETYIVLSSEDIVMRCEARGKPTPMFRWTRDGVEFDLSSDPDVVRMNNSGTFTIPNNNGLAMKNYKGKYRCYASNDLGTAISKEIHLIAESTPKWPKETIRPFEVEEGESLVLPCNPPTSSIPHRIYWMNDTFLHIVQNERVSMGLNGDLYFSNVKVEDSQLNYICSAHFTSTRTILQKETIVVTVKPSNSVKFRKPKFIMPEGEKSNYLALRGKDLKLECITEGLPTPTISWTRVDGPMPADRVSYENYNKTLHINSMTEVDDGEYHCAVENTQGTARHSYSVMVEAAPYWIKKPENGVYGIGETVRLGCEVEGKPKPKITWKINGEPIGKLDPDQRRIVKDGALILRDVITEDTAVWQCEAANKHGYIIANAYINILKLPPQILTQNNKEYAVVQDQTVFMDCKAFGAPQPQVQWENEDGEPVLQDVRYFIYTNGTLRIRKAGKNDSGLYNCSANNDLGSTAITAVLNVKNATRIIEPPKNTKVRNNTKANFECRAIFDASLDETAIHWKKGGVEIHEEGDNDKYFIEKEKLTINYANFKDQGTYTCVANTTLDSVEAHADLVVIERPDPPYDLKLYDHEDRSVRLAWTAGKEHKSPIHEFIIEFEEDVFDKGHWQKLETVDGSLDSVELKLSPFVNYQFRVIAINGVGKSDASKPSERFQTPPAAPDKNPAEIIGKGNDSHNLLITWKQLRGIDWNAPNLRYKVMWREKGKEDPWNETTIDTPPLLIENTPIFTEYEIQIQAINDEGMGPQPVSQVGYSGEDFPTAHPDNVTVKTINSTVVSVTWQRVPKDKIRGHLLGYKITYWKVQSRLHRRKRHTHQHEVRIPHDVTHAIITNLDPYSEYMLKVKVYNGKGDGPPSPAVTVLTPEGAPGKPASLKIEHLSDTSLILKWTQPHNPNGIIIGYELQYQKVSDPESIFESINIPNPVGLNWTVANLSPTSKYKFYLTAMTNGGLGRPIVIEGSTIPEKVVPTLNNVTYSTGDNYIHLKWITHELEQNIEFQIHYKSNKSEDIHKVKVNTTEMSLKLQNLDPGSSYNIKFKALNRTDEVTFWEDDVQVGGVVPSEMFESIATQGWFIGLISAIVLLILVLLIICFIKRNKGGKYSVKDKEDAHVDSEARPMKDETFGEYSDHEEKPFTSSQPSLNGDIKPLGSDDSLADYGGSVDVQFNEDGSFIGQYSGAREKDVTGGNDSSGGTSPVNAVRALE